MSEKWSKATFWRQWTAGEHEQITLFTRMNNNNVWQCFHISWYEQMGEWRLVVSFTQTWNFNVNILSAFKLWLYLNEHRRRYVTSKSLNRTISTHIHVWFMSELMIKLDVFQLNLEVEMREKKKFVTEFHVVPWLFYTSINIVFENNLWKTTRILNNFQGFRENRLLGWLWFYPLCLLSW